MRLSASRIAVVAVLSIVLGVVFAGVALAAPPWSDAPDTYWQTNYGVTDAQVGTVAAGYGDGTFRPTQPVKRGEFAKMAVDGLGLVPVHPATPTFKDVPVTNGFYNWIEGAHSAGLANGTTTTTGLLYKPGDNISRQQTNSILARYLADAELDATGFIHGIGGLTYASLDLWFAANPTFYLGAFDDAGQLGADHRATTAYLVFHGIVQGSNHKLTPNASLNRAQAATMVLRVRAEALSVTTPPAAPSNLRTTPANPGNDSTPRLSGTAIIGGVVRVYDTFGGVTTQVAEATANSAGNFDADLTVPLAEGAHSFTAKVKTSGGLMSSASVPVPYLLDTVAPTGSIIAPVVPAGQLDAAVNSAKPALTATGADVGSGLSRVEFQYAAQISLPTWATISVLPPDQVTPLGSPPYSAAWPAASDVANPLHNGLVDGQYQFRVVLADNAGNVTILGPVAVTIDTIPPDAAIFGSLIPPPGQTVFSTNDPRPFFAASATDPGIGASGVTEVAFVYAPWSGTSPPNLWSQFTQISSDTLPAFEAAYSGDIPDGHYLFAVRAIDRAGNVSLLTTNGTASPPIYTTGVTQEVIVDAHGPTGSITPTVPSGEPDAAVSSYAPTFAALPVDTLSGVKQVDFQYAVSSAPSTWITISTDSTFPYEAAWGGTMLIDGQYLFRAVAQDDLGNQATLGPVAVTVDTVAPPGGITAPTGDTVNVTQPAFTAAAADAGGSGVKQVRFEYGAGASPVAWMTISADADFPYQADWGGVSLIGAQTYTLRAIVTDRAGNTLTTGPVTVTVNLPI